MTRDDHGFTLIEMLMAIAILGIIVGALGTALIVALKNLDATQTRMAESHDAQMASAYVVTDVQSATGITTTQPKCGTTTSPVAVLSWSDQGTANVATYVLETAGGERRLRRTYVVGTSSNDVIVAHHLQATCGDATVDDPAIAVSESCAPPASCPSRVVLTLTDATGYRFSLTGERRVR